MPALVYMDAVLAYQQVPPSGNHAECAKLAAADGPVWTGAGYLPAIGTTVHVRINQIGDAVVCRYFVEDGYLGLYVRPLKPPAWYVKQNGRESCCHVFGAELDEVAP